MALFRPEPRPVNITAAASLVVNPEEPKNRSKAPDAAMLYDLYHRLGAIRAAMQMKYTAASKITYYPARRVDAQSDPEPTEDPRVVEAFERVKGQHGAFGDFVAETGMHWDIVGECYLVGEENEEESWDVWSAVEYDLRRQKRTLPDLVYRTWRPDPEDGLKPDSALRAVAPECEQYILFRDMLTSVGKSRLTSPVFIVPNEVDFPRDPNKPDETFGEWLLGAMVSTVQNTNSAGRVAPITLEVPGERAEQFKILDLTKDLPEWVTEVMSRILRQMAIGLDMPSDILAGIADVNHWSAWIIDDGLRLNYVDPLVLGVLNSYTRAYLWPTLRAMGVPDAESYMFWRDYSDLTSRAISPDTALQVWLEGGISDEAMRRTVGFTEADKPDEAQLRRNQPVALPAADGDPVRDIPEGLVASPGPSLAQIDHRLFAQVSEVAQAALDRALERAGARIRKEVQGAYRDGRAPKFQAQFQAIDGVDNHDVAFTLGPGIKETFQLSDDELIPEGTFDRAGQRVEKILSQGQDDAYRSVVELTGAEPERDTEAERGWVTAAVAALTSGLVTFALRRLFTPTIDPDPADTGEIPQTEIPANLVFDSLTIAGGGVPSTDPTQPRGLANGAETERWVTSVGHQIEERVWSTGAPTRPFEPHQRLSGTRFTAWTDEVLKTPYSASWLSVDYMFPGDHRGCQCVAELVIDEATPAEEAA